MTSIFAKRHPLPKAEQVRGGYKHYTLKQIVRRFYYSRFNRDPYEPAVNGEDIDNSRKFRLYNKQDIEEVIKLFVDFLEWALAEDNIEDINLSTNLSLYRDVELPKIKFANEMDRRIKKNIPDGDNYYITSGRYIYRLRYTNEVKDRLHEKWLADPRYLNKVLELEPLCKQKNEEAKKQNEDN